VSDTRVTSMKVGVHTHGCVEHRVTSTKSDATRCRARGRPVRQTIVCATQSHAGNDLAGSYVRLIDSGITQVNAQRPSRTCNESNFFFFITLKPRVERYKVL